MNRLNELFRAEGMPVFQNRMFNTAVEAKSCPRGNIVLVQDLNTGLIYNREFDSSLVVYDRNYQNEQGKFVAVTGMRVESPEDMLDRLPDGIDIIVMNPNYLQEIREQTGDRHHYRTTDLP